jgi:hypothetical protein
MNISKQKTWIHKNEVVESLVVEDGGRVKFYSHTYLVKESGRGWTPYVKWDNWERQPHVDKYDGTGALIETKPSTEKSGEDALKLVRIFRKNLLTMDLSQL